jgi:hypothetical protein
MLARTVTLRVVTCLVLLVAACDPGQGERACLLLEELPSQLSEARLEQLEELAAAARQSQTAEIRSIGERITTTLDQRHALENLAAGATIEVLAVELDELGRACREP